ncbi:MAG TPA: recombinase family protein [Urbifossiella sp.]|jgi:hypothetical protein|nr:recombinase family protein [Urbifossiella sp.]
MKRSVPEPAKPPPPPFVAYYRVSTERQGRSGLGLDAQRVAVRESVKRKGGRLAAEFTEIESGRKKDRPELTATPGPAEGEGVTARVARPAVQVGPPGETSN